MLTPIIIAALGLIPGIPGWVPPLIGAIVPAAIQIVKDLEGADGANGVKFALAASGIGKVLDSAFDAVPAWRELSEGQRDAIITGLVELALFASRLDPKSRKLNKRKTNKAIRDLKARS